MDKKFPIFNMLSSEEREILSNLDSAAGQDAPSLTSQIYYKKSMLNALNSFMALESKFAAIMPEPCLRVQ